MRVLTRLKLTVFLRLRRLYADTRQGDTTGPKRHWIEVTEVPSASFSPPPCYLLASLFTIYPQD